MPLPEFSPSRRRLVALRLVAQRVGESEFSTPGETVRWMLALQAPESRSARNMPVPFRPVRSLGT